MVYPKKKSEDPNSIFNGEREIGTSWDDFPRDHLNRYRFAQSLLPESAQVLDVGCGVGYGSHLLAQRAQHVTSIDYREEVIEYATEHWAGENQTFKVGNALEQATYGDAQYDLITAFEIIEHLPDDRLFLSLLKNALKPNGILCVSAPNLEILPDPEVNPWHFRHYTPDDFRRLLLEFFENAALFTQYTDQVVPGCGGRTNYIVAYNEFPRTFKLCFVSTEYPAPPNETTRYPSSGGIGTYTQSIALALANVGHDVHIVAQAKPDDHEHQYQDGKVTIHRLPNRPYVRSRVRKVLGPLADVLPRMLSVRRAFSRSSELSAVDLIETAEWRAEILLLNDRQIRSAAKVIRLHTPSFVTQAMVGQRMSWRYRAIDWFEKLNAHRSDAINSPSASLATMCRTSWRLAPIELIPNPMLPEETIGTPLDGPVKRLGYFPGRFDTYKGFPVLADALHTFLAKTPDRFKFLLVGSDYVYGESIKKLSSLQKWVDQGDDDTRPLKVVSRQTHVDTQALIAGVDAVILASRYENAPYVVLEAMAAGKIVIAPRVGGLPEMIEHGVTGFLFEANSAVSLETCLTQLASMDGSSAQTMSNAAIKMAHERFGVKPLLPVFEVYYAHVIGKKRHGEKRARPFGWWLPKHGSLVPGWLYQLRQNVSKWARFRASN